MRRKKSSDVYEPRIDGVCGGAIDQVDADDLELLDPAQDTLFLKRRGEPRVKANAMRSILGRHVRVEDIT